MRYDISTNGRTFQRTCEDNDSRLRIFNIGDYPVEVAINGGSYSEPFYRNQSFDISITKTPVTIRSIGGNSEVRTYRVYCSNVDECDIEGYFEPLTVESYETLIAKRAVLKSDIAQNLTNPNKVNVPSTKAVVAALTEFMSNFGSPLRYKGSVKTYNDLPTSNRVVGDMYNVEEPSDDYVAGTNFAWTGEVWDALGGTLSVLPSAITKFNETVTKAVQDFERLAVVRKTELTEIYENAVLAISGDGGLIDTAAETLQSYVDQGYGYAVDTHSNLEQVKTLASEVEDDRRQVAALEQSVRTNATEVRKLKEDLGDISSAVKTATTAEANVRALESSAWLAASRAEEISDPENRISDLQRTKSNRGEIFLQDGKIEASQTIEMNSAFSVVWTATRDVDVYGGVGGDYRKPYVYTGIDHGYQKGLTLTMDDQWVGFYFRWQKPNKGAGRISNTLNVQKYFDGKPHVWAYVFNGTSVKLIVDGSIIANAPVDDFAPTTPTYPLTITSPNSTISRIKYFNFDMSIGDAPYTIADYISGKDESPLLQRGEDYSSTSNWTARWSNASIVSTTNTLEVTTTKDENSQNLPIIVPPRSFITGQTIEVSYDSITTSSNLTLINPQLYITGNLIPYTSITGNRLSVVVGKTGTGSLEFTIKVKESAIPSGTMFVITGLKIKVNGALLSLEDYTFNGKVFDTSGKNNTATITGAVYGTKDNAVEQMYQAFASRIQNVTME